MTEVEVPLAEFQRISGLPDSAVVWLLKNNKIPLAYSAERGITVDLTHPVTKSLVESLIHEHHQALSEEGSLIRERIRTVINTHLEGVLEEALTRLNGVAKKSA